MAMRLRITAQPKSSRRERYFSEQDSGRRRAHRFIRAESNPDRFDHPTVEIPDQWKKPGLHISITLVTVPSEQAPMPCIHPYPIHTNEPGVTRDTQRNTLFFPVSEAEITKGQKSFRITLDKLVQYELRNYRQLLLLHGDQMDIQRVNDPIDARKLIETYQLGKSQLLFSMAEILKDGVPVIYDSSCVYSNVMTASQQTSSTDDDSLIRYAPQKGDWQGGDEVIMIIPKIDRRKSCQVYFEHPSMNQPISIPKDFVDTRSLLFKTPPCPIRATGNQTMETAIIVKQGGEEIARVNFCYRSCDSCISCVRNTILDDLDRTDVYEQSSALNLGFDENEDFIFTDESS